MGTVRIGSCGYRFYDPGEEWQERYESKLQAYSDAFEVGELNRTFYSLPQISTAERWRREAVEGFTFTLKAWQAITHPWSSPTWNSHRDDVPEGRTDQVGYLKPTGFVREAWDRTRAVAESLDAAAVLVQTPPSFGATEEHAGNLRELLGSIDRGGLAIAWEPRGDWVDHPDWVASLCNELELIHTVDPLRTEPLGDHDEAYLRLHGLNDDPYDYDYDYSDDELEELADRLRGVAEPRDLVYCLFNNYEMYANALELRAQMGE